MSPIEAIMLSIAITVIMRLASYLLEITLSDFLIIITLFIIILIYGINKSRSTILELLYLSLGTIASVYAFDKGYDSWAYHLKATLLLSEGWNPFLENDPALWAEKSLKLFQPNQDYYWVEVYPKASWFVGQELARIFGNLEAVKAISVFITLHVYKIWKEVLENQSLKHSKFYAILITCSPIAISQFYTAYVDGLLGLSISAMIGAHLNYLQGKNVKHVIIMGLYAIFAANLKYTGAVYVVLLGVPMIVQCLKNNGRAITLIIFLGLLVSWNPYVTNALNYGDPLVGINSNDVMFNQMDEQFLEKNRFVKAIYGYFYSNIDPYEVQNNLGPFDQRSHHELRKLVTEQDLEIGGFGPLFGICFVILIFAYILTVFLKRFERLDQVDGFIGLLLITILINPEFWWSRYVPQFWLLSVLIIIQLKRRDAFSRIVLIVTTMLGTTSAFMLIGWLASTIVVTDRVHGQISQIYIDKMYADTSPQNISFSPVARTILGAKQQNLIIENGECTKYDRYFSHIKGCSVENWRAK